MTVALIAIPAATSRNMNQRLSPYIYTAMLLGAISSGLGIWLYPILGIPPGLLIVIISALMFVLSLFFKSKSKNFRWFSDNCSIKKLPFWREFFE